MFVKRFDVLLLLVLVTARVRIDTLADLAAPRPIETVRKVGWLVGWFPEPAWKLMEDWLTDPISLLLISITFALVLVYIVVDLLTDQPTNQLSKHPTNHPTIKWVLVFAIIFTTVIAQSVYLIALRHVTGPASYTHDGGVIQTEETIKFLLQGKNPYTEDYTKTPMADWGLDYKTALYHYPYLPWTFLFSLPFFVVSNAALGWYDQRMVYLLLFVIMLALATRLTPHPTAKLALVMVLGLNPIMGSDVIFGQNDSFVLFWMVLALWLLAGRRGDEAAPPRGDEETSKRGNGVNLVSSSPRLPVYLSLTAFALACASKPTAWFLAPFFLLYAMRPTLHASRRSSRSRRDFTPHVFRLMLFITVFLIIVLPFILWDPYNFYDDVWAWSAGTSPTAYQIRGWGLSNFVLALNLVPSRLAYFPFWIPELLVCVPLFVLLLRRQWRDNTLANVAWHGGLLLFAFAFTSRFLNENYLGFIVSLLAVGVLCGDDQPSEI